MKNIKNKIKKYVALICVLIVASSLLAFIEVKIALFVENPVPVYVIPDIQVRREPLTIKEYVLGEFTKAGLNTKTAEAIIDCESKWNTQAININTNKTLDAGLWQINSIHKDISLQDKLNYKLATKWAINKIKRDGGFNAWSCSRLVARN